MASAQKPRQLVFTCIHAAGSWNSRGVYLRYLSEEKMSAYGDFTLIWVPAPRKELELLEKFLLMGRKEIESDQIEVLVGHQIGLQEYSCIS